MENFVCVTVGKEREIIPSGREVWLKAVVRGLIGVTRDIISDKEQYYITYEGTWVENIIMHIKNKSFKFENFGDEKCQQYLEDTLKMLLEMGFLKKL